MISERQKAEVKLSTEIASISKALISFLDQKDIMSVIIMRVLSRI